jgi:NAD(P)H-flavin reductase
MEQLSQQLNLEVIHVLQKPPDNWSGEEGKVDDPMIKRHLAEMGEMDIEYFVCGPIPVIQITEDSLIGQNVPRWRIVSERFDLV